AVDGCFRHSDQSVIYQYNCTSYSDGGHRALPSFPTRRSSDLPGGDPVRQALALGLRRRPLFPEQSPGQRQGTEHGDDESQYQTDHGGGGQHPDELADGATDGHQRGQCQYGGDLCGEGRQTIAADGGEHALAEGLAAVVDLVVQALQQNDEHIDDHHQRDHHADDHQLVERIPHQPDDQQHSGEGDGHRQAGNDRLAPGDGQQQD